MASQNRRAREQANAYESVFASTPLELEFDDGTTETVQIPPHPNLHMLDDDRLEAYDELLMEIESYDREPDIYIPEQHLENGIVLPAETKRGRPLEPYRRDGELVRPPHTIRMVRAAIGDELYERILAGGKSAKHVLEIWNNQGLKLAERSEIDSKSNGGPRGLASLPR